ncbi:branched-chain amino acid aminotransferase [Chitinophaga skermanii]|uniref:branched-chain-amino-acid transaminase n=1 Tax=Chitinophaga skermanii TaxID=331697 RepID=A0A327Q345_9BACT|nr:aminotransferase class IV [Chitinophaga skermanii]RAI98453.1 branched-chain amino acid aminotransferase [Chitinophaga skermanii]
MQLCYNGSFLAADKPVFTADNRSFRYGDGCFETMRVYQGQIMLADLHFERLFTSLRILHFNVPTHFTKTYLTKFILELCHLNNVSNLARVRVTVFRGGGGLYAPEDNTPHFLIQCWELQRQVFELNIQGLTLDIYADARKSADKIGNVKSNNCLPYILASQYAKQHQFNEVVLLNQYGRVADTTIANIFVVKQQTIYTPPLSEGCVCGVMRKHLLKGESPFKIKEQPLSIDDLENADEIFLSNAIFGIRWVGAFRDSSYGNATAAILHDLVHEGML